MLRLIVVCLGVVLVVGPAARVGRPQLRPEAVEHAYGMNNVGVAWLEQFNPPKAAESFREALRLAPTLAIARQRHSHRGTISVTHALPGTGLIPLHLRQYAGLEKEVSIIDTGARLEIWDRARYEHELNTIQVERQDLANEVGDLGL